MLKRGIPIEGQCHGISMSMIDEPLRLDPSPNFPYTILQLIYPYLVSQADTRKVLTKILYHGASLWQKQHSHQEQGHLVRPCDHEHKPETLNMLLLNQTVL